MSSFQGRSAIVFGATTGIGAATARLLAERGAHVTLVGRRRELGQKVTDDCSSTGVGCQFVQADVSDDSQVAAAVAAAVSAYGELTMAANVAAIDTVKPFVDLTDDDFDSLFNTNTRGTWHCMKHEIPAMLAAGGGRHRQRQLDRQSHHDNGQLPVRSEQAGRHRAHRVRRFRIRSSRDSREPDVAWRDAY